jgi:tRNA G18 (ribose-2'-O)-methylase SpoU
MSSARMGRGESREASGAEILTSRENRWLKEFRVALRGGVATATGAVGVEGLRLVEEALSSGCRVEAVLFSESGERWRERLAPLVGTAEMGFPVLRTTDRLFEGIADTEHPQGVAALVVPRVVTLEELVGGEKFLVSEKEGASSLRTSGSAEATERGTQRAQSKEGRRQRRDVENGEEAQRRETQDSEKTTQEPLAGDEGGAPKEKSPCAALIVVLAGVQDPGNVGTIMRTAAAFGATGVVTAATGQSGTASPFAPKALRASAGAALHLPVLTGMAMGVLLTQLKVMGIRTVASCVHEEGADALAPWEVEWCEPVALLVGNEGAGLPEDVVHAADGRIHIPMATEVESLNAGAAAAVVLYEAYRQRRRRRGDQ